MSKAPKKKEEPKELNWTQQLAKNRAAKMSVKAPPPPKVKE